MTRRCQGVCYRKSHDVFLMLLLSLTDAPWRAVDNAQLEIGFRQTTWKGMRYLHMITASRLMNIVAAGL